MFPSGRTASLSVVLVAALILTSCGGPGPVGPSGILVDGEVLDVDGQPLAGLLLFIPGHPTEVSNVDGEFSFEGVTTPYDLTLVDVASDFGHMYVGLTTTSPTLVPLPAQLQAASGEFSATIAGDMLHATLSPLPLNHGARVCAEGIGRVVLGCMTLTSGSTYNLFPRWSGNMSVTVRLRAVVYETDANGEATNVVATGVSSSFALTDGDALAGQDVTVADDTAQETVSVTTTVPPGYTLQGRQLIATYSEYASISPGAAVGPAASAMVVTPELAGATHTVLAQALNDDVVAGNTTIAWRADVDLADPVSLALPTPPSQDSPAEMATGVDPETQFAVSNPEGGVVTFLFQPQPPLEGPTIGVSTSETATTIPDLTALGLPFPSGADYTWTLLSTPDSLTADDAVAGGGLLGEFVRLALVSDGGAPAPGSSGRISTSPAREFATD